MSTKGNKAWIARHKAAGLCVKCGIPAKPNRTMCEDHLLAITRNDLIRKFGLDPTPNTDVCCSICGLKETWSDKWASSEPRLAVDHDHQMGMIRGYLCKRCNLGLGMFRDNPSLLQAAREYLL